jgi:hypothetical protein
MCEGLHTKLTHNSQDYSGYILALRDLCTDLRLFEAEPFDADHPVFMALWRTSLDMSKDDCHFVENVIGFYRETLDVTALGVEPPTGGGEGEGLQHGR